MSNHLYARLPHHVVAAGCNDFTPGDDDRFDCFFGCHISGDRGVLQRELEPRDLVVAEFAAIAQACDRPCGFVAVLLVANSSPSRVPASNGNRSTKMLLLFPGVARFLRLADRVR